MAVSGERLLACDRRWSQGGRLVLAGVDEAGRGAWAGPVVAAAVVLPPDWCPPGLDDSKKLGPRRRDELSRIIMASALCWGACSVPSPVIDRVNILQATLLAMARSLAKLDPVPDLALIDGTQSPPVSLACRTLVGGDGASASIAAASILAKVFRDRIMTAWDRRHPGYGFAAHKGYGAASHRRALQELGPCPIHRLSYRPLTLLDQGRLF
ncbi:MAG: ribonuclease HII [bacterium]|nr:ribonuclease HII [bacterium]